MILIQTVRVGDRLTVRVVATGSEILGYQWSLDGVEISGATQAEYGVAAAQESNAGSYTIRVTNPAGTVVSAPATVTVNPTSVELRVDSTRLLNDQTIQLVLSGPTDAQVTVEASEDLIIWNVITTATLTGGAATVIDAEATTQSARFHRVRTP